MENNNVDCNRGLEAGCKARCCKLKVILSDEELDGGIIKSEAVTLGKNTLHIVAKGKDDYCIYLNIKTFKCKIYANRPIGCMEYSCINDSRISRVVRGSKNETFINV